MTAPLAYRFGGAFFCELPFYVNKHVLIPRFDTEVLVETVIQNCKIKSKILDMCTGSGCIATVLALHDLFVTASDVSRSALRVARKNAKLHDVKTEFVKSDLFSGLARRKFDAVVCNPPYVKTGEIGKWDKNILHEPRIAFDGGPDGLDFYRKIIGQVSEYLTNNGQIFFEIDREQGKAVENLLRERNFCDIKIVKDKQGLSRVVHARKRIL
jgi:release factor glutamine methyltransferase